MTNETRRPPAETVHNLEGSSGLNCEPKEPLHFLRSPGAGRLPTATLEISMAYRK